ncbi:MAG: 2-oxo acid dehydrogenase subunit E2, partial [Pseudomonadota bacterium]
FKSAGEPVKPGDNLFEIETDQVSMEVPSTTAGVLAEIRVLAGEVALVGAVVAVIAPGAGAAATMKSAQVDSPPLPGGERADRPAGTAGPLFPIAGGGAEAVPAQAPAPALVPLDPFFEVRTPERNFGPARLPGGTAVTPLARRLAAECGIDLSRVRGSGPRGRIVAADIEAAPLPSSVPLYGRAEGAPAAEIKALYAPDSYVEVPLDRIRRTVAERLTQAQTVPHFYLTADIEIGRLIALREEANAAVATLLPSPRPLAGTGSEGELKLSLNDFLIRALALALQRVPAANTVWAGDRILRFTHSDIAVAVAVEDGLIAPVVRNAEQKSLGVISAEVKDFSARARAKKLMPGDYLGGSCTISNLGMHGVREFSAIINPPQSTILAVGAVERRPVETDTGGVAFASRMTVTLGCDHRVIDGMVGAALLAAFRRIIEMPMSIVL